MPRTKAVIVAPMHGQGISLGRLFRGGNRYARKNKVVSRGLMAAAPRAGKYAPAVYGGSVLAGMLGYGKPARKRKAPAKKKRRVRRS